MSELYQKRQKRLQHKELQLEFASESFGEKTRGEKRENSRKTQEEPNSSGRKLH